MLRLTGMLLFCASLFGAEPPPEDQAAMQAALKQYLKALNECDLHQAAAVRAKVSQIRASGFPLEFRNWLNMNPASCGPSRPAFEVTGLARILEVITPEVTASDGFFRAMNLPGGEKAGALNVLFVRENSAWKLSGLRFYAVPLDRPLLPVTPAGRHDTPDPDGWVTLFDGKNADAFLEVGGGPFPASWKVENGLLEAVRATAPGMTMHGLRTRDTYKSFELRFSWKVAERGNSGIKYHLFYLHSGPTGSDGAGFEYQLADDEGDPGAKRHPIERTGSLYNQIAARGAQPKPLGEFNESVLIVRGRHCEHWLNGVKVVEFETESNPPESPILIQHHRTGAAFRSIRIRRLD